MKCPLDIEIRSGWGLKADAERAAALMRERLGLCGTERLPAIAAAKDLGVRVLHPHQFRSMPEEVVHELENGSASQWSAVFLQLPAPLKDLIVNNRKQSPERQEANIFHELGHYICKHEPDKIEVVAGFPIRQYSKAKEDQADAVGQALHLPKKALMKAKRTGLSDSEISSEYCASNELVRFRLNISGVMKILSRSR